MAFLSREYEEAVAALAQRNIFVGTSSWKYPGWIGQLYDEQRYLWRGKVSNARFERECLEEYGRVFKSVCVDAGYYRFPTEETLPKLVAQVPDDFLFSFTAAILGHNHSLDLYETYSSHSSIVKRRRRRKKRCGCHTIYRNEILAF